ncbi:phage holin family protein [Vreelandella alkaliphila]|uniref:Phage holin family protein n=1 Tax=Vreelandella alkaliphila TaxID=272774 RepID=A0AAJ2S0P4_9GAMM|nr:phage holin family protein [Halomonas alkaliphila]MDX5979601.1 phage holin family protein [Halomonas alkaliphila]
MSSQDPNNYTTLFQLAGFSGLALWGGFVSYYQRFLRAGRKFRLIIFTGEMSTSVLAGIVMFYLCRAYAVNEPLSAALVALSGLAGGKMLERAEQIMNNRVSQILGGPGDNDKGAK